MSRTAWPTTLWPQFTIPSPGSQPAGRPENHGASLGYMPTATGDLQTRPFGMKQSAG